MSTILDVLDFIGYRFEGTGDYRRCKQHDSLVVNIEKDVFFWNSLGYGGNAITFLTKVEGMSFGEAKRLISNLTGEPYRPKDYVKKPIVLPNNEKIKYLRQRAEYYYRNLFDHKSMLDYWESQGINRYSVDNFRLGFANECPTAPNIDSFTIPYTLNDKVINIKHRLNSDDKGKYRSELKGISNYLFNVDGLYTMDDGLLWPGDLVLLEGEKKAIVFHQNGIRAVAIPGANTWRSEFIDELKKAGIDTVYIMLDPGMEEQSEKIAEDIRSNGTKAKSVFVPEKPDDLILSGIKPKEIVGVLK